MDETQIKQIIERQPLHGTALLDPRCKILLLVCIGFVSYFLAGETRISYGLRTAYPERDAEHYQEKSHSQNTTHLLEVHDLGFAYKKGPDVFRNVSFEAHSGDVIGILGHNGAGKTTLLSILTGLLKQRHGEIRLDGKKLTPRQRRSLSYLVMQDTDYQLFASSVEEELSLGMQEDCKEKIDAVLNALELSDYRERHPASLSGGQKQRVTIGVAIVKDSPVIYFDEPTSGLDYDSMVRVSKLIEQLSDSGVIVFVVSHDFEFIVRTCTEVVQPDDDGTIQNRSCQKFSKQICLWNLVQVIGILFIIQIVEAI